jgi:hypothetical protein
MGREEDRSATRMTGRGAVSKLGAHRKVVARLAKRSLRITLVCPIEQWAGLAGPV